MKIGEKVTCVNDDFSNIIDFDFTVYDELPRKGNKYTIRRKETWGNKTRVLLEEIKNPPLKNGALKGVEPGFDGSRFKTLIKDKVKEEQEEESIKK